MMKSITILAIFLLGTLFVQVNIAELVDEISAIVKTELIRILDIETAKLRSSYKEFLGNVSEKIIGPRCSKSAAKKLRQDLGQANVTFYECREEAQKNVTDYSFISNVVNKIEEYQSNLIEHRAVTSGNIRKIKSVRELIEKMKICFGNSHEVFMRYATVHSLSCFIFFGF